MKLQDYINAACTPDIQRTRFQALVAQYVGFGREIIGAATIVAGDYREGRHSQAWSLANVSTSEVLPEHNCFIIRDGARIYGAHVNRHGGFDGDLFFSGPGCAANGADVLALFQ